MNIKTSDQAITYSLRNLQRIPEKKKKEQETVHKRTTAETCAMVIFQILEGRKTAGWT